MQAATTPDYYDRLQVSPRADAETIERVFRLLAKRLHPDNRETGDADRFAALVEAFRILSDPQSRAQYDIAYEASSRERYRVFGPSVEETSAGTDRRFQFALLSILYKARRNDANKPGVGVIDMERLLDCPESQMTFHLWYLKERNFITRLDNGMYAITVTGVDRVLELDRSNGDGLHLLKRGTGEPGPAAAAG
jgi:curved DNA-binding protein CbpA